MCRIIPIALLGLLIGCAHHTAAPTTAPMALEAAYSYPASALVFDPPITQGLPAIDLPRDGREMSAFGGYQQQTTSYTYQFTNDRQSTDYRNSYDRNTITVQVGTTTR